MLNRERFYYFLFYVFLLMSSSIIFQLNSYTPYLADDIARINVVTTFTTLRQWLDHLVSFYLTWGGRIQGELYLCIFSKLPKSLFNIINTMGYTLTILCIVANIKNKNIC